MSESSNDPTAAGAVDKVENLGESSAVSLPAAADNLPAQTATDGSVDPAAIDSIIAPNMAGAILISLKYFDALTYSRSIVWGGERLSAVIVNSLTPLYSI